MHMLARFGSPDDREFVRSMLKGSAHVSSPYGRHVTYAALSVVGSEPDVAQEFADMLIRDDEFCSASLTFDAMHYGDIEFTQIGDGEPMRFHNTFGRLLRRVVQAANTPSQSANLIKLVRILSNADSTIQKTIRTNTWINCELSVLVDSCQVAPMIRQELTAAAKTHLLM